MLAKYIVWGELYKVFFNWLQYQSKVLWWIAIIQQELI